MCKDGFGVIIPSPNTKKATLGTTGELGRESTEPLHFTVGQSIKDVPKMFGIPPWEFISVHTSFMNGAMVPFAVLFKIN